MKKRLLAITLVLLILLSLMSGCGNAGSDSPVSSEQGVTETTESEISIYPLTEEVVTFSYFTGFMTEFSGVINSMDDFKAIAEAESITNIHIDWRLVAGAAMVDSMNLMFATGECTDFISSATDFYQGGGLQAVNDGILLDLTEYVPEYMPNYYGYLQNNPSVLLEVTENDTSFTYIRKIIEQNFVSIGMTVRQDWLDALEMDVPTTYDELSSVLAAFKTEYDCSRTIYLDKEANFGYGFLAFGYGTPGYRIGAHTESQYYQVDGTVYSSLLQDGYRDYLNLAAEWYKAGYISSDFVTADSRPGGDAQAEAINTGDTGVWKTSLNVIGDIDIWRANPDIVLTPLEWIGVDSNTVNHFADLSHSDQQNVSISANCKYPELACQWADFWFTDYGIQIWNWGMEGDCYELSDSGQVVFLDSLYDNEWGLSASSAIQAYSMASYSIPSIQAADRFSAFYSDAQQNAYDVWNGNSDDMYTMASTDISPEYAEEYSVIINDICTYAEEMILKFIVGEKDTSTDWDDYISNLKTLNIDRAIEIMQLSYNDYLSK